jgi:Leucine-rich repeat (LRR) protein
MFWNHIALPVHIQSLFERVSGTTATAQSTSTEYTRSARYTLNQPVSHTSPRCIARHLRAHGTRNTARSTVLALH